MDLSTVKDNLQCDEYETPQQFIADMRLIFENSRKYNTNNKSRVRSLGSLFTHTISRLVEVDGWLSISIPWKFLMNSQRRLVHDFLSWEQFQGEEIDNCCKREIYCKEKTNTLIGICYNRKKYFRNIFSFSHELLEFAFICSTNNLRFVKFSQNRSYF